MKSIKESFVSLRTMFWWYGEKQPQVVIHTQVFGSVLGYKAMESIQRPMDRSINFTLKTQVGFFTSKNLK